MNGEGVWGCFSGALVFEAGFDGTGFLLLSCTGLETADLLLLSPAGFLG